MTERFSQRRLAKIASWIILRQLCSSGCAADKYHFVYAFIYRSYKFMHKVVLEGDPEACFQACGLGGIINPGLLSEILSYGFSTNVCPDAQMCSGTATHFPLRQSFFTTKMGGVGLTQDGAADFVPGLGGGMEKTAEQGRSRPWRPSWREPGFVPVPAWADDPGSREGARPRAGTRAPISVRAPWWRRPRATTPPRPRSAQSARRAGASGAAFPAAAGRRSARRCTTPS